MGFSAVVHPAWSSLDVVVLAVMASDPKKVCMWEVYSPGTTMGSMFFSMKRSATTMV